MQDLKDAILAEGIEVELTGRTKHIYSVYRKMRQKQRTFEEIYDVIGIRCIIPDDRVKDCYGVLGIIHSMWHPIPGEFDDYIATPKQSMYQSLHTAVIGPEGHALEIQIRTQRMHEIAEFGVAAHWRYKEGKKADAKVEAKVAWLRQMLEWQAEMKDAEDFVETVKSDVLEEMIYVFTPKGDIIELPAGATPLDFAYRIHTEVGHHTVRAKVNDQLVRLDTKLKNGQVVEISTSKTKLGPSRDWLREDLGYLTTASAKEKIRQWFRRQEREENLAQGKEILEKELRRLGVDLKPEDIHKHFPRYNKVEDMIAAIGYGAISPQLIASRLGESETKNVLSRHAARAEAARAAAAGRDGCRRPADLLGDLLQAGQRRRDRRLCHARPGHHRSPGRLLEPRQPARSGAADPGHLGSKAGETYPVNIMVRAWDRVGLLKDISTLLADEKVNILYVQTVTNDDRTVSLRITIEVENVVQLSRVLHKIESVPAVDEVRRDASNGAAATRLAGD